MFASGPINLCVGQPDSSAEDFVKNAKLKKVGRVLTFLSSQTLTIFFCYYAWLRFCCKWKHHCNRWQNHQISIAQNGTKSWSMQPPSQPSDNCWGRQDEHVYVNADLRAITLECHFLNIWLQLEAAIDSSYLHPAFPLQPSLVSGAWLPIGKCHWIASAPMTAIQGLHA